jgi:RNA polymerase sigma-70 factor (ECF subfamily)
MTQALLYDENEILFKVASGDQKAFTILVDNYWNKVYSHALAYTKSSSRAQEITQDVFLKIWYKRKSLPEIRDFKNYLFILSRHHIISAMRKKLGDFTCNDLLETPEGTLIPDQQLEYKETWNLILEGIEKLPTARKAIFKMSRLEGLSYEDIAEKRNISKNTVKEHIVLALNFLRTYIHLYRNLPVIFTYLLIIFKNTFPPLK